MKKLGFIVAAAMPLLFAACSGNEDYNVPDGDELVSVSFSASIDHAVQTRAVTGESDGTNATQLYVAVYNATGNLIEAISKIGTTNSEATATMSSLAATVDFQLVKGQTYSFAFWAQNPNATAGAVTFDPATGKVTVDYTKINANDLSLDAFTAHVNDLTVTGAVAQNITLKRPWAQVNYGATPADVKAAHLAGIDIAKTKVTVNNVYSTLNLLTGKVEGTASTTDIVLAAAAIPSTTTGLPAASTFAVDIDNLATPTTATYGKLHVGSDDPTAVTDFAYMGLNYLLVGDEGSQSLIKADLELYKTGDDTTPVNTLAFSNVPVQRNYRTNIVGNLLTSQVQFNVTLDANYEEPDYVVSLADQEALDAVIDAINDGTSTATAITLDPVADNATFDFSNLDATLLNTPISVTANKTVTISNLNTKKNDTTTPPLTVGASSTVNIVNSNISSADGSVTDVRAINVADNAVVHISGSTIDGGSYPYARGLNILGDGAIVTVDADSDVKGTYAINLPSAAVNNHIVVNGATIEGWSILNVWNSNNVFELNNCVLNSTNNTTYNAEGWNDFAAFKFNDNGTNTATNNTVTITDCTVTVKATTGNRQYLCDFTSPTGNTVKFEGNTSITGTTTNTFNTGNNTWYMNSGLPGFTLTYGDDVTFAGDWAGTDGYEIDRY